MKKTVSVVIPAYNEEASLASTLNTITSYLQERKYTYEVLVVDDGSTDNTAAIASSFADRHVLLLQNLGNRGKGYTVRQGILQARHEIVLFSDADLSTPFDELERCLPLFEQGYSVVVGSRALKESEVKIHQPIHRELLGKAFNRLVQLAAVPGISDTQCGFKLFTREAARAIFTKQKINGFGFDVEVLHLAKKQGISIKEQPVRWYNNPDSKVHPLKDPLSMLFDLARTRWLHRGKKL